MRNRRVQYDNPPNGETLVERVVFYDNVLPGGNGQVHFLDEVAGSKAIDQRFTTVYDTAQENCYLSGEVGFVRNYADSGKYEIVGSHGLVRRATAAGAISEAGTGTAYLQTPSGNVAITVWNTWLDEDLEESDELWVIWQGELGTANASTGITPGRWVVFTTGGSGGATHVHFKLTSTLQTSDEFSPTDADVTEVLFTGSQPVAVSDKIPLKNQPTDNGSVWKFSGETDDVGKAFYNPLTSKWEIYTLQKNGGGATHILFTLDGTFSKTDATTDITMDTLLFEGSEAAPVGSVTAANLKTEVLNKYSFEGDAGDYGMALYDSELSRWQIYQMGKRGSGATIIEFELTEAMAITDLTKLADVKEVTHLGDEFVLSTATSITVRNQTVSDGNHLFAGEIGAVGQAYYNRSQGHWNIFQLECFEAEVANELNPA